MKHAALGVAPSNNTGGDFTFRFTIPSAVHKQLSDRQAAYPIQWAPPERNATWLIPSRLLASIYFATPSDKAAVKATIDGVPLEVYRSYNSRGLVRSRVFLGHYLDLSEAKIVPDAAHELKLSLPANMTKGAFVGVFLENVVTEYTEELEACALV